MNGIKHKVVDNRRRNLLLGALAASATGLLQACGGGASGREEVASSQGVTLLADSTVVTSVPPNQVNLADYGGVPGAAAATIKSAFTQAFTRLKALGGGTLNVTPGTYDMGTYSASTSILEVSGLSNVNISAYGATFRTNTTANVITYMFCFYTPNNVTFSGAAFTDVGFVSNVEWHGTWCIFADSSVACSGMRVVDCSVNGAVGLFNVNPAGAGKNKISNILVKGTATNVYYGVGMSYPGDGAQIDIVCNNARRAVIGYGIRNASLKVKLTCTNTWIGSNSAIALVCAGTTAGNVENVNIDLEVAGYGRQGALVHIWHEEPETTGTIRNVNAKLTLNNLQASSVSVEAFALDWFDNSTTRTSTARLYENITLTGAVIGSFTGTMITNRSVSTGSTNLVRVANNLAALQNMSLLPNYFQVFTPPTEPAPSPAPSPAPAPSPVPSPTPTPVPVPTPYPGGSTAPVPRSCP